MPIKLELQGVSKRYEESTAVVSGLSCRVEEGQFTVVLGPSGCGKTTTMLVVLVNLGAVWAVRPWMREHVTA